MKLSPDLHDEDFDGPEFDGGDAYGASRVEAYFPEPANETDGSGAFELASDSHEQDARPEPHVLADRVSEAFSADDHGADTGGIGETLRVMRGSWALIGLAAIAAMGVVGFTTSSLWQVIYLRGIGASAFVGGMALALFNTSMFAGRILNAPLVVRFGPWTSLFVSGAGMFGAAVLLLLPGGVPMGVAAFMLLGLSCAGTVPTVLSVAARLSPGRSSAVTAGIMSVPYIANMALPGLTGAIADQTSLRVALLVVGVSGVGIMLVVRRITPPRAR